MANKPWELTPQERSDICESCDRFKAYDYPRARAAQKKMLEYQNELCRKHTTIIVVDGNARNTKRR